MMFRLGRVPFLLLFVLAVSLAGCADNATPVPTAPMSSSAAVSASAGCQALQFQATTVIRFTDPGPPIFDLSGDLEGTMEVHVDPASLKYSGPPPMFSGGTNSWHGTAVWSVTGGIVPDLTTFETAVTNRNLISDRPGSPATVWENIGTHKATSGVGKANLSYNGIAVADLVLQTQTVTHRYVGVICR